MHRVVILLRTFFTPAGEEMKGLSDLASVTRMTSRNTRGVCGGQPSGESVVIWKIHETVYAYPDDDFVSHHHSDNAPEVVAFERSLGVWKMVFETS